jgi:hypothetical protein
MAETSINIIDALRGQEAQLRRLLAQKVLISEAPKPQLSEIEATVKCLSWTAVRYWFEFPATTRKTQQSQTTIKLNGWLFSKPNRHGRAAMRESGQSGNSFVSDRNSLLIIPAV